MTLLGLNFILLLRTPVRHSSWRDEVDPFFAALLVPPWKLLRDTDVQIQSWVFEHPCSQAFCGAWHCCWEGNNSQTGSRRLILVTAICASHYTEHKPTKKHHPCSTDGFSYSLQFRNSGWYLKSQNFLFSMSFQESQKKKEDKSGHQS